MNIKNRIIEGHYLLHLIVGDKYYISYGVHQGIYTYQGQIEENENNNDFWLGASVFVNDETNKEFRYFGTTTPYEFTSIVHKI